MAKTKNINSANQTLTVATLERLKGHTIVSKQFISDLTNNRFIIQVERDIIRDSLKDEPNTVNVSDFSKKVREQLLPLTTIDSREGVPRYESISLQDELRGDIGNYFERIYESSIKTSAGYIHFGETPMGDEGGIEHYFGHTRLEDMADNKTRRVIEVQSDLYQKGNIERETTLSGIDYDGKMLMQQKKLAEKTKKLYQYNNPTAHYRIIREEIRFAAIDSNYTAYTEGRQGIEKLQFPTGETAMKIEGIGDNNRWSFGRVDRETGYINNDNLSKDSIGKLVSDEYSDWIITDVLGDGKFKAVLKRNLEIQNDGELWSYAENNNLMTLPDQDGDRSVDVEKALRNIGFINKYSSSYGETFDISGNVDISNPIYKFYEKDIGRYLRNKYDAQLVTDSEGVTWFEINIKPEMATQPVLAFGDSYSDLDHLRKNLKQNDRNFKPLQTRNDIQIQANNNAINKNQIQNKLKQSKMTKESNQGETSEAQVFLNEAVEHVKEFINGHPPKESVTVLPNEVTQEQKQLASIRAIRERSNVKARSRSFKEEGEDKGNGDKDEEEKDYE